MPKDFETRTLPVTISHLVDAAFPLFVECSFLDADGNQITIVEKLPVVSDVSEWDNQNTPIAGGIVCECKAFFVDEDGRAVTRINTDRPWGVSSTDGETSFVVLTSLLLDNP